MKNEPKYLIGVGVAVAGRPPGPANNCTLPTTFHLNLMLIQGVLAAWLDGRDGADIKIPKTHLRISLVV